MITANSASVVKLVRLVGLMSVFFSASLFAQAMYVAPTGQVGVGTDVPTSSLEVIGLQETVGVGNSVVKLTKAGGLAFQLDDTDVPGFWNFAAAVGESQFRVSRSGTGQTELIVTETGDLTIAGQLITSGPLCEFGCDRVFKPEYQLPTIEEHAAQMWENSFLPAIGPTDPNKPVNISNQYGNMLNELETAHIYIAQLNKEKESLSAKVETLESRLSELESLMVR